VPNEAHVVVPGDQYISEQHMLVKITTSSQTPPPKGKGAKGKGKGKSVRDGQDSAAVVVSI
jgi:hypothetical protein